MAQQTIEHDNHNAVPDELRLVEPTDFETQGDIHYQSRLAYLLMRDRPLVWSTGNRLIIEPAPGVTHITWMGRREKLPYEDHSVTITRASGVLTIDTTRVKSDKARHTIHRLALLAADAIYGTEYRLAMNTTQDALDTYVSIGAAMTTEYPRDHTHLTYGTVGDGPNATETFALHTPSGREDIWRMHSTITIQTTNRLVRRRFSTEAIGGTPDNHRQQMAKTITTMRDALERYSWTTTDGTVIAPVGWNHMH